MTSVCPDRTIRDAAVEDAEFLCDAERSVVRRHDGLLVSNEDELSSEAFKQRIASASRGVGKYVVAHTTAGVVGHGSLTPMSLRNLSHVLRLDLCVHLGYWRRGHGEALLASLVEWARAVPAARKIELLVRASNGPAIALYEAQGFVEEGRLRERVRLRDGRYVDDVTMALTLRT